MLKLLKRLYKLIRAEILLHYRDQPQLGDCYSFMYKGELSYAIVAEILLGSDGLAEQVLYEIKGAKISKIINAYTTTKATALLPDAFDLKRVKNIPVEIQLYIDMLPLRIITK